MTDNNDPEDANSTGDVQAMYNPLISTNIEEHDFQKDGQEVLFDLGDCTVYNIKLECQDEGCSQEFNKFVAMGNLPRKPEDAIKITNQIYRWFYDNHQNVPMWSEDPSHYVATSAILPTDDIHPRDLGPRFSLMAAAVIGYLDGRNNKTKKEKMEIAHLTVNLTELTLSQAPDGDLEILLNGLSNTLD